MTCADTGTFDMASLELLDEGTFTFSVASRIVRELGERLVKQPEVAFVELVKNAYDADATVCRLTHDPQQGIEVSDDGHGMTVAEFQSGWMRIGTGAKESTRHSRTFGRVITGEKGIGRFAVRFLGRRLHLESTADDPERGVRTLLTARFDWPEFDRTEDIGRIRVPYQLARANDRSTGTELRVSALRPAAKRVDLDAVRTASVSVVTPYAPLLRKSGSGRGRARSAEGGGGGDPGFALEVRQQGGKRAVDPDVARVILGNAVLRAVVELRGDRVRLRVYRGASQQATLEINDQYRNSVREAYADIRFFPKRRGTFADLPVDGRVARRWVKDHGGVAIFDRQFRVLPYGMPGDDWLLLAADTAKRAREPRSSLAKTHFPMDEPTRGSTRLNYMLRLPYPQQLVGVVQVEGRRSVDQATDLEGLVAAADREGFVDNAAFRELYDVVRGAVEAIATEDRDLQQELEREEQELLARALKAETQDAIKEIQANPNLKRSDKNRIVKRLTETEALAQWYEQRAREREATLEVMSLMGVVAGFMTHEFGAALEELERAHTVLKQAGGRDTRMASAAVSVGRRIEALRDFAAYSQGYIRGASARPVSAFPVRPRIRQVTKAFGKYAADREIEIEIDVGPDIMAPLVPVALYNGIVLNLFSNALKAVTAKSGAGDRMVAFRSWNEGGRHYLEVSDTGVGIPTALKERVFDPLFTTTASNRDPLGSGMGLGLTLVRRSAESYGGRVKVTEPTGEFSTCIRVELPVTEL